MKDSFSQILKARSDREIEKMFKNSHFVNLMILTASSTAKDKNITLDFIAIFVIIQVSRTRQTR